MGSGSKQTHATYATAPTATAVIDEGTDLLPPTEPDATPVTEADLLPGAGAAASEAPPWQQDIDAVEDALSQLNTVLAEGPAGYALVDPADDELAHWYATMQNLVDSAQHHLAQAQAAGADPAQIDAYTKQVAKAAGGALMAATAEELQKLAAAQGFSYPQLVGLNGSPQALAHWLNPAYPSDSVSKAGIQAKAVERFEHLCAGKEVAGFSLADVKITGGPPVTWTATPEEFQQLKTAFHKNTAAFTALPTHDTAGRQKALAALLVTENALSSAGLLTDPDYAVMVKASAADKIAQITADLTATSPTYCAALDAAVAVGALSEEQRAVLPPAAAFALARHATPAVVKQQAVLKAQTRIEEVMKAKVGYLGLTGYLDATDQCVQVPETFVFDPAVPASYVEPVSGMANVAAMHYSSANAVQAWAWQVGGYAQATGLSPDQVAPSPAELTKSFNAWAVGKSAAGLRLAAAELGLEHAAMASKHDARKYITSCWDPAIDKDAVQAAVAAKAGATAKAPISAVTTASAGGKPTADPPKTATAAAKPSGNTGEKTGFGAQHAKLVHALAQHASVSAEVPKAVDPKVVAAHDFGTGTSAAAMGGMHTKSVHTGPDGGKWLFKPDKKGGGARAAAEVAASRIYQAAGLPSVPVYTATVAGKAGVVQPLVKNAAPLVAIASSWTQAEVDSIVRQHVASWVMGDHDANPNNILKTSSGGLIPVDGGQAFKHYGTDKLALDYKPNGKFGALPPAHHIAYQTALAGNLSPGVKIKPSVAHPVIKKLEAIPDAQWRAMLHATAHQGAKTPGIAWVPAMRKRAAAKHGIPVEKVQPTQVAEAFLDHACERKAGLRAAFADFFTKELKLDGDILKYGA
jgi:hypothetical protein